MIFHRIFKILNFLPNLNGQMSSKVFNIQKHLRNQKIESKGADSISLASSVENKNRKIEPKNRRGGAMRRTSPLDGDWCFLRVVQVTKISAKNHRTTTWGCPFYPSIDGLQTAREAGRETRRKDPSNDLLERNARAHTSICTSARAHQILFCARARAGINRWD